VAKQQRYSTFLTGSRNYESPCTLSLKKDTDVSHYNFNAHQPILLIFGTDIAE